MPTWPILAPLGPSWRQHRLQEASKWSSTGGLDRICGHLGAKRAPRAQPPKNGNHFPAKLSKNIIFHSKNEPHGILSRLNRLNRLKRKRNIRSRTDPGFPTPGARMTVVYTNSLKLALLGRTCASHATRCCLVGKHDLPCLRRPGMHRDSWHSYNYLSN